jgi:hypothetical protein
MQKKVVLYDLENHTVVYQGLAQMHMISKNVRQIEFGSKKHRYVFTIYEKGCRIRSISEIEVDLILSSFSKSSGKIISEHGAMEIAAALDEYSQSQEKVTVHYHLFEQQEQQNFHFCLQIQ